MIAKVLSKIDNLLKKKFPLLDEEPDQNLIVYVEVYKTQIIEREYDLLTLNYLLKQANNLNNKILIRAAYFSIILDKLISDSYAGQIIYEGNYNTFLNIISSTRINLSIINEINLLNNWQSYQNNESVVTYIKLLFKVQIIESFQKKPLKVTLDYKYLINEISEA